MFNLKWTNKYSQETGYVAKVVKSKGYFENTFEQSKAKKYRYRTEAEREIEYLISIGEGDNNIFQPEEHKTTPVKKAKEVSDKIIRQIVCPECGNRTSEVAGIYKCHTCLISFRKATVKDLMFKARFYIEEGNNL